ncbi:hypothetical protein AOX55_0000512 [Sinorhizobium fredii CCBAU 25509]|nr:hypothetical protein AOX55_0000512 [Sinorhizobium fredii CCBAU 25509]
MPSLPDHVKGGKGGGRQRAATPASGKIAEPGRAKKRSGFTVPITSR